MYRRKTNFAFEFLLSCLLLFSAQQGRGAGFTTIVSFNGTNGYPSQAAQGSPMVLGADGNFYGTTTEGGANGQGNIFKVTPQGVITPLHDFDGTNDGYAPNGLTLANDGNFYGTAWNGGAAGGGTLFKMTPDGALNVMISFASTNGFYPQAAPVQAGDGNLYGPVSSGAGVHAWSGIYRATLGGLAGILLVLDDSLVGYAPLAPLVVGSDGYLYGTCSANGPNSTGSVFRIDTNGFLTLLHAFGPVTNNATGANADGTTPIGPLAEGPGGVFYGTASSGGVNSFGTIFSVSTNGFTIIRQLTANDGESPTGLILGRDGNFYGTTDGGGLSSAFQLKPDGTFTTYGNQLTGHITDGEDVNAPMVEGLDGNFYGTMYGGGVNFDGTIFRLSVGGGSSVTPGTGKALLTLQTNGSGSIRPNDGGKLLTVGAKYTLAAVPAAGWMCSNWVASGSQAFTTNKAALTFAMSSNLVLTANFVTNPFIPLAGIYQGLCLGATNVTLDDSGSFKATVQKTGAFSAVLGLGGKSHPFSGQFTAGGLATNDIVITRTNILTVELQLDLTGANGLTGTVGNGVWSSVIQAYVGKLYPVTATQKYTMAIAGAADSAVAPGGDGFGLLTVTKGGNVSFSGILADNTPVAATASLSQAGLWPFYAALFGGKGMVVGWLALADGASNDISGGLTWIESPHNGVKYYAAGFTNQSQVMGSIYNFTNGFPVLNLTNDSFYLTNGDVAAGLVDPVFLSLNQAFSTNDPSLKLDFSPGTGRFQGSVANPVIGATPDPLTFKGTALQKQNIAVGFYLGTNQSGIAGLGSNAPAQFTGGTSSGNNGLFSLQIATVGNGSVSVSPPGPSYFPGQMVTLTATARVGSAFAGWSGDAAGTGTNAQITMDTNHSVTATFDLTNSPFNGTWVGTVNTTFSNGVCSTTATANVNLTFSVTAGVVSGNGSASGMPCFSGAGCAINGYPPVSGTITGTATSITIKAHLNGVASGGACNGQSAGLNIDGNLGQEWGNNYTGPTITWSSGGTTVSLTKQ